MKKKKQRKHNEWFMKSAIRRKTCTNHLPGVGKHLAPDREIWKWGEYVHGKWNHISDYCRECWPTIAERLNEHAGPCGCTITLMPRSGSPLPEWMTLGHGAQC